MLTTQRLICLTLVSILVLGAPSALADPKDKSAAGSDECPGNGHRDDKPGNGNGHGRACDEDASQEETSTTEEQNEAEEEGNGSSGHPHGQPPGQNENGSPSQGESPGQGKPNEQPSPSPSSSPSPGPGQPPGQNDPGTLAIDVDVSRTVAQVGTTLTYTIRVTNTGTSPTSAVVYNEIPAEVDLVSAVLPRRAPGSGPVGWALDDLAPGSVTTLTWVGRVARAGDLDAVNVVRVEGVEAPAVETHTYLATVQGLRVQRSANEPDWGTHTERRVVYRAPDPDAPDVAGAPSNAPSAQLPFTGFPTLEIAFIAALLLLGGLVLLGRGKRVAAVAMMVVLVAAACTSESPTPAERPGADADARDDESEEEDRVLGKRVKKGSDDSDQSGTEDVADDTTEDADDTSDVPGVADGSEDATGDEPVASDDDGGDDALVRDVVLVEVANDAPEPQGLGSTSGFNTISLTWDQSSRSVLSATSSRSISADSPIDLVASLSDAGNGMRSTVTLTNVSDSERLLVRGELVLEIAGDNGASIRLTSNGLDEVLDPGDEVFAEFVLAVPSGSYTVHPSFSAS